AIPRLEQQMEDAEASAGALDRLVDILRLVIRIEASEINQVFKSVVAATDSDFVRCLRAFQMAGEDHIAGIAAQIPKFEPELADECRALRAEICGEGAG
ncbi:MAG: hypothetical protein JSV86_03785, partial [Gemmatimonadota bacterium]